MLIVIFGVTPGTAATTLDSIASLTSSWIGSEWELRQDRFQRCRRLQRQSGLLWFREDDPFRIGMARNSRRINSAVELDIRIGGGKKG